MKELDQLCISDQKVIGGRLDKPQVARLTAIMKALSHPVRVRMVDLIHQAGGDVCVCEFEKHFELTQPTISHHLKILRDAGLIQSRQDGTWVRHSIDREVFVGAQELLGAFAADLEPV